VLAIHEERSYSTLLLDSSGNGSFFVNLSGQEAFMNVVLQDTLFGCERINTRMFRYVSSQNYFGSDENANAFDNEKYDEFVKDMVHSIDPAHMIFRVHNEINKSDYQ